MKTLLGTKLGMTQLLAEDGKAIPVTLIQAGPVTVTQVKTVETDGYNAVQVAFGEGKNLSKAVAGHVKPAQVTPKHIREFRVDQIPEDLKVGSEINVSAFEVGDSVDATEPAKVKVSLEPLNATTLSVIVRRTVVKVILVSQVQLARCIHKKSSRVRRWLATWVTNVLLSRTWKWHMLIQRPI